MISPSKHLQIGANLANVFDVKETALNTDAYRNQVATLVYQFQHQTEKLALELSGESGFSNTYSTEQLNSNLTDYFIHVIGKSNLKTIRLTVEAGYMDNGADFRSAGAQSKRIDFNQLTLLRHGGTKKCRNEMKRTNKDTRR